MRNRVFVCSMVLLFVLPLTLSGQLSPAAIDDLATRHVEKWSQYLNLTTYRKAKLKEVWIDHEKRKSEILRRSDDIQGKLKEENMSFVASLKKIFTPSELVFYEQYEQLRMDDDRVYLTNLIEAISSDSLLIEAYTDLQYNKIFPFKMTARMEFEEAISTADKRTLDLIREEVFEHYDKCLVTCLVRDHDKSDLFQNFDELIIVALNKDLDNDDSALSQLIQLTHKYEDDIHDIYIKHRARFDSLDKESRDLKDEYILKGHNEGLLDLRKRNGLSSLNHVESEAAFMLLDPFDHNASRKLFNLDLYNRL